MFDADNELEFIGTDILKLIAYLFLVPVEARPCQDRHQGFIEAHSRRLANVGRTIFELDSEVIAFLCEHKT